MPAPKLPDMTIWEALRYCNNAMNGHGVLSEAKLRTAIATLREQKHLLKAAGPMADKADAWLLAKLEKRT